MAIGSRRQHPPWCRESCHDQLDRSSHDGAGRQHAGPRTCVPRCLLHGWGGPVLMKCCVWHSCWHSTSSNRPDRAGPAGRGHGPELRRRGGPDLVDGPVATSNSRVGGSNPSGRAISAAQRPSCGGRLWPSRRLVIPSAQSGQPTRHSAQDATRGARLRGAGATANKLSGMRLRPVCRWRRPRGVRAPVGSPLLPLERWSPRPARCCQPAWRWRWRSTARSASPRVA
jgi:hypothetical protein